MAASDLRTRYVRAANLHKNPEKRAYFAKRYKEIYGKDVPVMSGPVLEGEMGLGPPTTPRGKPEPKAAAPQSDYKPAAPTRGYLESLWEGIKHPIDATGRELRSLGAIALPGYIKPDPTDTDHATRAKRADYIGDQASSIATLGVSRPLMDIFGAGLGDTRRAELEADPNVATIPAKTMAGLMGSGVSALGGPGAMVDQTVMGTAKYIAPQAVNKTLPQMALGAGSAAIQNTAQNVAEKRDPTEHIGWASALGLIGPALARMAMGGQKVLRGTPDDPTQTGIYREGVESGRYQHKATSPDQSFSLEGLPITRPAAEVKKVDPDSVMAMRDQREAAELAAARGSRRHQQMSNKRREELEAKVKPDLGARIGRDAILRHAEGRMAANIDPNLGVVDGGMQSALQRVVSRLEATRPPPGAPVMHGARPVTDQPGLPLPGRAPLQQPTPPMSVPREAHQGRLPFGEQPVPPGPYGTQPTPPMNVPRETYQARMPYAVDDVSTTPVGRGQQPEVEERWAPGGAGAQFRERLPAPVGQEVVSADRSQMSLLDLAASAGRGPPPNAPRFADPGETPPTSLPVRPPSQMEISSPGPSRVPHPDMAPPREMFPPDPRAGQQLEIDSPAPGEIPGFEAEGGVGPYQARLPLPEPEAQPLDLDEVLRNPTLGGIRKLRAQARKDANFDSPGPASKSETKARAEYEVWDQAIKEFAPQHFKDVEQEMIQSARAARKRGDIMYRSEESVVRGGDLPDPDRRARVEDLSDQADGTMRVGREQAVRKFFQRTGDTNVPGNDMRSYQEEIGAADPELSAAQDFVRSRKALEAHRPGLRALLPLDAQGALDPLKLALLSQWGRVVGGRMIDPALGVIARNFGKSNRLVPLLRDPLDAIMAKSKKKKDEPVEEEEPKTPGSWMNRRSGSFKGE